MQICTLIFLDGRGLKPFYQERLKKVSNFSHSPAPRDEQEYLYEVDEDADDYPDDGVELAHGDLLGSLHCGHHLLLVLKCCHNVSMLLLIRMIPTSPYHKSSHGHNTNHNDHTINNHMVISSKPHACLLLIALKSVMWHFPPDGFKV